MTHGTPVKLPEENLIEVFIQVQGEAPRHGSVEVSSSATLQYLRSLIIDELDDFEFDFKFIKQSGYNLLSYCFLIFLLFCLFLCYLLILTVVIRSRCAVISSKQEAIRSVADALDNDSNITVQRTAVLPSTPMEM